MNWPFGHLQPARYKVVLCDPPWAFRTFSAKGLHKSPERHYPTMDIADIRALPVRELADPTGCVLVMWTTAPHLALAMAILPAWGFTYKSMGVWAKRSRTGKAWQFGGGYIFRSAMEPYLVGTIGQPGLPLVRDVRNLIVAPVREHSRKPDDLHVSLERMFAGPRCELFARETRPGWETWGTERTKFDGCSDGHAGRDAGSASAGADGRRDGTSSKQSCDASGRSARSSHTQLDLWSD